MILEGVYADRKYVRVSVVVLNEGKSTADAGQVDENLQEQFNDNIRGTDIPGHLPPAHFPPPPDILLGRIIATPRNKNVDRTSPPC